MVDAAETRPAHTTGGAGTTPPTRLPSGRLLERSPPFRLMWLRNESIAPTKITVVTNRKNGKINCPLTPLP